MYNPLFMSSASSRKNKPMGILHLWYSPNAKILSRKSTEKRWSWGDMITLEPYYCTCLILITTHTSEIIVLTLYTNLPKSDMPPPPLLDAMQQNNPKQMGSHFGIWNYRYRRLLIKVDWRSGLLGTLLVSQHYLNKYTQSHRRYCIIPIFGITSAITSCTCI